MAYEALRSGAARGTMRTAPDQCIICRRRSPRGLEPRLTDSKGRKASIHTYHRFNTIYAAGFSIDILPLSDMGTPGTWTLR